MQKPIIAFITGGFSGEAEISYKTAKTIVANIDLNKFEYYRIDIRTDGWWCTLNEQEIAIDKNDFSVTINNTKIKFDAVLNGIHGTPGEDGKLAGYFDILGIPYTSCNAASSAITFNKRYTTAIAGVSGIHVAKSLLFFKTDTIDINSIAEQLIFPVFVKPNNGGSSIGMSKVPNKEGLAAAIEKAFKEDNQVLIEEFIAGREFTIGVCRIKGNLVALPMTEVISQNYFFDFEAKYLGKSNEITPAVASPEQYEKVNSAAEKIYQLFDCKGVIRIDFIYNEANNQPYMLEVNTVPGQTEASIVPQQVKAIGMSLKDFYSGLIEECLVNKEQ